jgi:hypothetical protein
MREGALAMSLVGLLLAILLAIAGAGFLTVSSSETSGVEVAPAEPAIMTEMSVLVLVERTDHVTDVDLGAPGLTPGDMIVWGPNPLYDEANEVDTGATTQGVCIILDASGACVLTETVRFPDGSTLELQGTEAGGTNPASRTIVGGSGTYIGATGSVWAEPSEDLSTWTKTFEILLSA